MTPLAFVLAVTSLVLGVALVAAATVCFLQARSIRRARQSHRALWTAHNRLIIFTTAPVDAGVPEEWVP